MDAIVKFLSTLLVLLYIFQQGFGQCGLSNIVITRANTGAVVEGQPEYEVSVTNNCDCPQSNVLVKCLGLSSVEPVNSHAIRPVDETNCVLNDGNPIVQGSSIKFKYAWLNPQDFPVVSSKIQC